MVLDSIMLKDLMPDLRQRVIKNIEGDLEDLFALHLEYEIALNKFMEKIN
jgi:hypothetical protein